MGSGIGPMIINPFCLSFRERFLVKANGMSSFVDKLQQQGTTVFEDLGSIDLHPELYLVVQVIRVGKMFAESTKKSNQVKINV